MKNQRIQLIVAGVLGVLLWASGNSAINAADPPLTPGNPLSGVTHTEFSGVGGTNTSVTSSTANAALTAFEAAIGGVRNAAASPQTGGFRAINWDGVALDGTDFGGNTTIIVSNKVVGIPINRFETQGVLFEEIYAVSGPVGGADQSTFVSVNPNVSTLFPAFSPTKTFAMFNDNTIGLSFILASPATATPVRVATRGFGAIFRNIRITNSTSIEYFNGARSLGKFFVPVGTGGQAEFLGELFNAPIVTSVQIVCGTDTLFTFDGLTFKGTTTDNTSTGHNLVVTDDFAYAEPVAVSNAQPGIAATAGVIFNGLVAIFSDLDPSGNAKNFTATIDWGDGHFSPGTITANANGGFNVTGTNTYAGGGSFPVTVDIADLQGSGLTIQNTATVTGAGQLLNISTRAHVETGDNVLIGGFIIGSTTGNTKVIVRALGPSLANVGVSGFLEDPTLELHNGNGTLNSANDNWKMRTDGTSQQAEIEATTIPPTNDLESALVATLVPGNYTAIVRGTLNTTGIAVVEVYNIP
jgi:hypothetical protein